MAAKNIMAALIVVIAWGLNFVAMKTAFQDVPPFLFLFLRLLLTVFPLVFFLPRPKAPLSIMAWFALFQWVLHFSLLFLGMYIGLSGGISSLVMQSHVLFTIILTVIYFNARPTLLQMMGLAVSFSGLVVLTTHGDCSANWVGILLILAAAFAVSIANLLFKGVGKDENMSSVIVWSSLLALPLAAILCLLIEGWDQSYVAIQEITMPTIVSLCYTVFVSTMVGIVTWGKLMQSTDSVKALPFTLLVPVIALSSGHYVLGEAVSSLDIIASLIIISGLLLNQLSMLKKAKVVPLEKPAEQPAKEAA